MLASHTHKQLAIAGSALLLICIGIGYSMWSRGQEELLWGYRPLFFLLAGWLSFICFKYWRRTKKGQAFPKKELLLSSLSGLLLGIGFPDILPVPFLLFVAWVPLLLVLEKHQNTDKKRVFLGFAFHTFIVWNVVATYWVMNTAFVAGLFANFVNSLLMCIPFLLYLISKKYMPKLGFMPLIAYWLCFEYIHLQWELTWPWLNLGNGWAEYPSLIQWYSYTGTFGGSLWVWVANILVLNTYLSYQNQKQFDTLAVLKTTAWMLLPMALSVFMYSSYTEKENPIDVVVVQPNFEPHYQKFNIGEREQIKRFAQLSLSQLDKEVDYLVFPETSYGFVKEEDVRDDAATRSLSRALAEFNDLNIITGLNAYHDLRPDELPSPATRERQQGGKSIAYEVFNLAAQIPINPAAEPQTYRKSKMVPGAESFPFKELLFFMEPLVNQLGGSVSGLGSQPERSVFSSQTAKIGPAICYESIFGEYYTGYVHAGAQAVFIMTNDGWWDNTAGHRQHLYYASLRAVETRRSIARSANTGISAFINQRGDILQPTQYDEPIAIRGNINLNDDITFYVQWGDIIARIALFASILFLLNTFVKARIKE